MNNSAAASALASLIGEAPGVRAALTCDRQGDLVEDMGRDFGRAGASAALAVTVDQLDRAGRLLRLGACQLTVVKGPSATCLLASQGDLIAAIALEPRRPSAELEAKLLDGAWAQAAPAVTAPDLQRSLTPADLPAVARPHPAVFTGQLQLFCLPDLLEFLRGGRRTGKLICESPSGLGMVRMRRGCITGAWSPGQARLGEYLVRHAVVSPDQVHAAVQAQADDGAGTLLGRVLIERQLATAADIRTALIAQVQDAVRTLKDWVEGQFTFEPEPAVEPSFAEVDVELDPQAILLTLFKEEDERQRGAV